jgi:hypothetical protein
VISGSQQVGAGAEVMQEWHKKCSLVSEHDSTTSERLVGTGAHP